MIDVNLDAKELAARVILNVKITNAAQWRIRTKIGRGLIRIAAWVMWCRIEFKDPES